MDIITREKMRNEVRALAYRRTIAKKRGKELQRVAGDSYETLCAATELLLDSSSLTRHTNVAYGLLKGRPYKKIEQKSAAKPDPKKVLDVIHQNCTWADKREWTLDKVKELLK